MKNPYKLCLIVENDLGIHARPSTRISEIAREYKGKIEYAKKGGSFVNAESVIEILSQCTKNGEQVCFHIFPENPVTSENLEGSRSVIGDLENAVAHDDD